MWVFVSLISERETNLTFCMYPEKRSAVEEMAFFTLLSKSFFTSGEEMSFFKSR